MNRLLWVIQGLLALLFLYAGGIKLVLPTEKLAGQMGFSAPFLRFIGVAEVLGGIGLVLPGILRIRVSLTPLAAACLVIIMIGATWATITNQGFVSALTPLVTGLLLIFVLWGRLRATRHTTPHTT